VCRFAASVAKKNDWSKVRTTMLSAVESTFSAQHFLTSLLFISTILAHSAFSEAVQESCPYRCICETFYEITAVSVACNDLELTEIPTTPFAPSVQSLDLSSNTLNHIREFVFKDYSNVVNLSLCDNHIDDVDARAFFGLTKLRNIDLSYKNIQFINASMFSDNPVLQSVSFKRNPLVYVPDTSPILASHSVSSIDLSYCFLNSLNSHTLSQLPSFQFVDLSSNNLQELHQNIRKPLTELIFINLTTIDGNVTVTSWKC
jgi:Leucine-rich repeat (LRR) protein